MKPRSWGSGVSAAAAVVVAVGALAVATTAVAAPGDVTATQVANINPAGASSSPSGLTNVNGTVLFSASDGMNGVELWRTVPPYTSATMVEDMVPGGGINPGANDSAPDDLTNVNGTLFFSATDGTSGTELWKSVAPYTSATLVADIAGSDSDPQQLTDVNGTLFFSANDDGTGRELFKSVFPYASATLVKDINTTSSEAHSNPNELTNVNGTLFFAADNGIDGEELWKSVGPGYDASSTSPVANIRPLGDGSDPNRLTDLNGTLLFSANDGATSGYELWKSNGGALGPGGTEQVKDINPMGASSFPTELTNVNGTLLFTATGMGIGEELYKSNGTGPGTVLVEDIDGTAAGTEPNKFLAIGDTLFFVAFTTAIGSELYKSVPPYDMASTGLISDIQPGMGNGAPAQPPADLGGTLLFQANDGMSGIELWKSAPPYATATLAADINPGVPDSAPTSMVNAGGTLLFRATQAGSGAELWKATIEAPVTPVTPVTPAPPAKKKCKKGRKLKKGRCVKKKKKK